MKRKAKPYSIRNIRPDIFENEMMKMQWCNQLWLISDDIHHLWRKWYSILESDIENDEKKKISADNHESDEMKKKAEVMTTWKKAKMKKWRYYVNYSEENKWYYSLIRCIRDIRRKRNENEASIINESGNIDNVSEENVNRRNMKKKMKKWRNILKIVTINEKQWWRNENQKCRDIDNIIEMAKEKERERRGKWQKIFSM